MTAEYPKEAQNPETIPGRRPDRQPQPEIRVPRETNDGPESRDKADERTPTTQESPEAGAPKGVEGDLRSNA